MYSKRVKIFIAIIASAMLICIGRLVQMQLVDSSYYRQQVADLKNLQSTSQQLTTLRGSILDRNGQILAEDVATFNVNIAYKLSRFMDLRVCDAMLLRARAKTNARTEIGEVEEQINSALEKIELIIEKCANFGLSSEDVEKRLKQINDEVWRQRKYIAWRRDFKTYQQFVEKYPTAEQQLLKIFSIDLAVMNQDYPLIELSSEDDIFTAQLEFMNIEEISIHPQSMRVYPFKSAACQTIGWVGPEQEKELFSDDKLQRYLEGEVSGRRPGVEYVCEPILRGRRGEEKYNIDSELVYKTKTEHGQDVQLTIDIDLQQAIEDFLSQSEIYSKYNGVIAAVIIDAKTGQILVMASLPTFDLNKVRYEYKQAFLSPNKPMLNRALANQYPPGSTIKPLILIAGLEEQKITPQDTISCSKDNTERPRCWLPRMYPWLGHDDKWPNNARNALKGSCNVYFSKLAQRLEPIELQEWLFKFGFGRKILLAPTTILGTDYDRGFKQARGLISSRKAGSKNKYLNFTDLPDLKKTDLRWFGIGQGSLYANPLQVANMMAAIARGGKYIRPKLFIEPNNYDESISLGISQKTIDVVKKGMFAVVNENEGTANNTFSEALDDYKNNGVKVFGKTGSTESPNNAWFAGFAEDSLGRSIAFSLIVEGGQSGSKDAAPLARDMVKILIEKGYTGSLN